MSKIETENLGYIILSKKDFDMLAPKDIILKPISKLAFDPQGNKSLSKSYSPGLYFGDLSKGESIEEYIDRNIASELFCAINHIFNLLNISYKTKTLLCIESERLYWDFRLIVKAYDYPKGNTNEINP